MNSIRTFLFFATAFFIAAWEELRENLAALFCYTHDFKFTGNFHDTKDSSLLAGSWWQCTKCHKIESRVDPYHFDPETHRLRRMYEPERAYYRGYMRRTLRIEPALDYDNAPILQENHDLGWQIAEWDLQDAEEKANQHLTNRLKFPFERLGRDEA